jgi:hypothetical protein
MKTFNENPFLKDTPVTPFYGSGETYRAWDADNCSKCKKCNRESTVPEDGCELEYYISLGTVNTGEIPLWVAKEIGCDYNALYQTVDLFDKCRRFDNGNIF